MAVPRRPRPARADGNTTQVLYSPGVALEICERIGRGQRWSHIAGTGRLPSENAIYRWRKREPIFAEAYAQARELAREGWTGEPWPAVFDRLAETGRPSAAGNPRFPSRAADENGAVVLVRYSADLARRICERIGSGEVWEHFCNRDGFPSNMMLYDWRRHRPEFAEALDEATKAGARARFERALAVAEASTAATVTSDKLRVEVLMRQAALLDPEHFSPRKPREEADQPIRRITIRRFERAVRADGSEYVRAIDSVQEVEQ